MTKATMSRSELIAALKAQKVKGALSKMRKADLQRMLTEHGGAGQHGGHGYKVDGTLGKGEADKYKHVHAKKSFPAGAQAGSGLSYRQFVATEMRSNGGNMRTAAAKWKEQKGGHFVLQDGKVAPEQSSKYEHSHPGTNPVTGAFRLPDAVAPSTAKAMKAPAKEDAPSPKAKAPKPALVVTPAKLARKVPKGSHRMPDGSIMKDSAMKRPGKKQPRTDDSIFDTLEQTQAKKKAAEAAAKAKAKARATARPRPAAAAAAAAPKKARASTAMTDAEKTKRAKARLKADAYSSAWMKHMDQAYARGIFDMPTISANYQKGKAAKQRADRDAGDAADDRAFAAQEYDEGQAAATQAAKAAIKAAGKVPKKKRDQSGAGLVDAADAGEGESIAARAEAILDRGIAYLGNRDYGEARADFEEVLRLVPEYTTAQEYIDTLDHRERQQIEAAYRRLALARVAQAMPGSRTMDLAPGVAGLAEQGGAGHPADLAPDVAEYVEQHGSGLESWWAGERKNHPYWTDVAEGVGIAGIATAGLLTGGTEAWAAAEGAEAVADAAEGTELTDFGAGASEDAGAADEDAAEEAKAARKAKKAAQGRMTKPTGFRSVVKSAREAKNLGVSPWSAAGKHDTNGFLDSKKPLVSQRGRWCARRRAQDTGSGGERRPRRRTDEGQRHRRGCALSL